MHTHKGLIADELARKGTTIEILQEKNTIGMPIATYRLFIKQKTLMYPAAKSPTDMAMTQSTTYQDNTLPTKVCCKNDHQGLIRALPKTHTCGRNGS